MTEQPAQAPQPSLATVVKMQSQEIARITENRIYLMSLLEDTKAEALAEIAQRDDHIVDLVTKTEQMRDAMWAGGLADDVQRITGETQEAEPI